MTLIIRALACLAVLSAAPAAWANAVTLYPATSATGVTGNTTTGAPSFGTSSFQESGSGKGEIYILPTALFGRPVSIGDIASISYWTNKPGGSDGVDWSFYIYTVKQAGDVSSYHTRLTSEPYFSNTSPVAANTWHQWASGGNSPMRFYDTARDGNIQGTYNDPTLADLEAGAYTWSATGTKVDYRSEVVNYFEIQTGSAWSAGFLGLVDGLTITLKDGTVGSANLEAINAVAVPEPGSIALFGIGAVGFLASARRRRRTS